MYLKKKLKIDTQQKTTIKVLTVLDDDINILQQFQLKRETTLTLF